MDEMKALIKKYSFLFIVLLLGITVSSCAKYTYTDKKSPDIEPYSGPPPTEPSSGPPPWASAPGYKAKFTYRYYPSSFVYFSIDRGIYFYRSGGVWVDSYYLPQTISLTQDGYVILKMDVDKPYTFHKDVSKKYPPALKKK
jgi:hypothetical protein